MNHFKSIEIARNHSIFVSKKVNFFSLIYKIENSDYEKGNIERKYLNKMRENQFLKE